MVTQVTLGMKKKIVLGFFISLIIFLALSLLCFVPNDRGWAYEDTFFQGIYYNRLGVVGAWCSSFLLYYMGGAVWVLLFMCMYICWHTYKKYPMDSLFTICMRFIALCFMVSIYAAFIASDYVPYIEPGGLLGQAIKRLIYLLHDHTVEQSVISILWMACSAFMFPFDYIRVPTKVVLAIERFYRRHIFFRSKRRMKAAPSCHQTTIEELIREIIMQKNE